MSVLNALVEIFSGDTKILRYTVKDGLGVVINITGGAFRWGLFKLDPNESEPTARGSALVPPGEKAVSSGITITDAVNGVLEVALVPADTATLKGDFYHELQMVLGGETSTVAFGQINIKRDGLE